MDYPFIVGERYANRKGTFQVLEITPPTMLVEYEHGGGTETLNVVVQSRIQQNMVREQSIPPPPALAAPRARASRATKTAGATAAPAASRATRTSRARATPVGRAAAREMVLLQWSALREAERAGRATLLRPALEDQTTFTGLVDSAIEAERGRYWLAPLAEVQALNTVEPMTRQAPPDQLLAHSLTHDRTYLTTPTQQVLARQYPVHEGSNTPYRVDLLGYDSTDERPLILVVRARTTGAQWLWEALFTVLDNWIVLRATAGLPASFGEAYPLSAPPGMGIIAPRAYWQENDPNRSTTARTQEGLSRNLISAIRNWLGMPLLLLEVGDDWLRQTGTPNQPEVRTAAW